MNTSPRESSIEKAVCKFARDHGLLAWKLTSPGNRGVPDRMFLGKDRRSPGGQSWIGEYGKVVFIEFKRPGGRLTELQARRGRELTALGFRWEVVDNTEDGKRILGEEFGL